MNPSVFALLVSITFTLGWFAAKWRYSRGFYGRLSSRLLTKLEAERSRGDEWRERCSGLVGNFHELREALEAYISEELELIDAPDDAQTVNARNNNLHTLMSVMKRTHP